MGTTNANTLYAANQQTLAAIDQVIQRHLAEFRKPGLHYPARL